VGLAGPQTASSVWLDARRPLVIDIPNVWMVADLRDHPLQVAVVAALRPS